MFEHGPTETMWFFPPHASNWTNAMGAPKRIAECLAALVREEERLELDGVPPATPAAQIAVLRDPRGLDRMETAMAVVFHLIETHRSSIQTAPPKAAEFVGADVADTHGHDDGVPAGPRQAGPSHRNRDSEDAQGSDLQLAFSGIPEVPPGPYGAGLSDFGTGYSSLSRLSDLPIDTLKIDRTFISRLAEVGPGKTLVSTITSLAHAFGMSVVAEGVETEDQLGLLWEMGCDQAQGFLLGKPVPADAFAELLEKRKGRLRFLAGRRELTAEDES
jgi:hypothetical protein